MAVTAKVQIYEISPGFGDGNSPVPEAQSVKFSADYQDERNKEWAHYTPAIQVLMTVRSEVVQSAGWKVGDRFTLTFDGSE